MIYIKRPHQIQYYPVMSAPPEDPEYKNPFTRITRTTTDSPPPNLTLFSARQSQTQDWKSRSSNHARFRAWDPPILLENTNNYCMSAKSSQSQGGLVLRSTPQKRPSGTDGGDAVGVNARLVHTPIRSPVRWDPVFEGDSDKTTSIQTKTGPTSCNHVLMMVVVVSGEVLLLWLYICM